jgi:hypothetical protein
MLLGLIILYFGSGTFQKLYGPGDDMGIWRWTFYSGAVLVLVGAVGAVLRQFAKLPRVIRVFLWIVGVVGQCTFPIFVLHLVVLQAKAVLVMLHVPEKVALGLVVSTFVAFCMWCITSLYKLHYGGQGLPAEIV